MLSTGGKTHVLPSYLFGVSFNLDETWWGGVVLGVEFIFGVISNTHITVSSPMSLSTESNVFECDTTTRLRRYVFVLNNYRDADLAAVRGMVNRYSGLRYLLFSLEVAPTTGTPHIQGFVCFKTATMRQAAQRALADSEDKEVWKRYILYPARGDIQSQLDYISKDGKQEIEEFGTRPKAGMRSDLIDLKAMVESGTALSEIAGCCTNYQQIRYVEALAGYRPHPLKVPPTIMWIHGNTGVGKSRLAQELALRQVGGKQDKIWKSSKDLTWFCGYTGQEAAIIDDFRGACSSFHWLLRLLDVNPVFVPVKGSQVYWNPSLIIITSSYLPQDCYPNITEDMEQLTRRLDSVWKLEICNDLPCLDMGEAGWKCLREEFWRYTPTIAKAIDPLDLVNLHGSWRIDIEDDSDTDSQCSAIPLTDVMPGNCLGMTQNPDLVDENTNEAIEEFCRELENYDPEDMMSVEPPTSPVHGFSDQESIGEPVPITGIKRVRSPSKEIRKRLRESEKNLEETVRALRELDERMEQEHYLARAEDITVDDDEVLCDEQELLALLEDEPEPTAPAVIDHAATDEERLARKEFQMLIEHEEAEIARIAAEEHIDLRAFDDPCPPPPVEQEVIDIDEQDDVIVIE